MSKKNHGLRAGFIGNKNVRRGTELMSEKEEIDNTIAEITEVINEAYEHLLHELFTFGDYMYDLSIEYQDVDGKTIKMSWQDRDKRISWLQGDV